MAEDEGGACGPPRPPQIPRRVHLPLYRWPGIALIVILPILALSGVFGEAVEEVVARGAELEVHVRYPTRMRFRDDERVVVEVRNRSPRTLDKVAVWFEPAFIVRFAKVTFLPGVSRAFQVDLRGVLPEEARLVVVELEGERYGRHTGAVRVSGPTESLAVRLCTFVFP